MKKLLVLALVLVTTNAFAVVDPTANGIGFYFDQLTANNNFSTGGTILSGATTAYLLATNITSTTGISGWECEVEVFPMMQEAIDIDEDGLFDYFQDAPPLYTLNTGTSLFPLPKFGVGGCVLPFAPVIKLLTVKVYNVQYPTLGEPTAKVKVPFRLSIGPMTPSSFGPGTLYPDVPIGPGYAVAPNGVPLVRLVPSSNVPVVGRPGFFTVATCISPPAPVADENDSWGSVKSLYK